ncbi:YaaR family protein [Halanaerobiaceae bacterium Z-7014]|uniref:YaaR family protein n=1 Tax=Halonatronomonas betaini TaxID=2778430 RepID=A0A931ASG6_9FIRM|nr:YaaR family protein [Halonatronomonas betaini]MBF8435789.1 YaaR family protein [Halonatronomonas betaini]
MRINSSNLNRDKQINNLVSRTDSPEKSSFQQKLEAVNEENIRERLDSLLDYVDQYGDKLKETMDKEDLQAYKAQVKEFLQIIQKEFARTKQSFSWDNQGNLKTYMIIEKINHEMEMLQEEFIQDQADVLEVVRRIDEIRGLLLDLYI